jgi:hypothetical protein
MMQNPVNEVLNNKVPCNSTGINSRKTSIFVDCLIHAQEAPTWLAVVAMQLHKVKDCKQSEDDKVR